MPKLDEFLPRAAGASSRFSVSPRHSTDRLLDDELGGFERHEDAARQGGLSRDSATVDALRTAWHKASQSLQPDRLAELPENKRAVALELYRVLSAAYEAECIVLEECSKAAERALK